MKRMRTSKLTRAGTGLGLAVVFATCLAMAGGPAVFKVSQLTFPRPKTWDWVPVHSPMRQAQLAVPSPSGGDKASVVFFYFGPGSGGGTQANVERWFHQFQEPREKIHAKVQTVTIGGTKVTYAEAQGTYLKGQPGQPQTPMANYALLGAVIEHGAGTVFVRMTGPQNLVKAQDATFRRMIEKALK